MATHPLRVTIDTNCLNAFGRASPAVHVLERWEAEGKLRRKGTERLLHEARYGEAARNKARAIATMGEPAVYEQSFFDAGAYFGEPGPSFDTVASVLFPTTSRAALTKNQRNDVMHLLAHHAGGSDVFVTEDSDFVLDHRREALRSLGITAMTPEELVNELQQSRGWT